MQKNNYSLMLSEGVVRAIDMEAARLGTNRSALINRILAEYVSYVTPEMRAREILSSVISALGGNFRTEGESETGVSLTSSLAYRYRPTVRYSLELYRSGAALGEIRVSMRTKNPALLRLFEEFCMRFASIEHRYLGDTEYVVGEGRFSRVLRLRKNDGISDMMTLTSLGNLVAEYIAMLDRALQAFCAYATDLYTAVSAVEEIYRAYLARTEVFL